MLTDEQIDFIWDACYDDEELQFKENEFARMCYQQGREDMHSDVMRIYSEPPIYDTRETRLKELK